MEWKLNNCCLSISDGDHLPPPKSDTGIPFITISNINDNQVDFSNTAYVPIDYYEKLDKIRKAQPGDILYSVVGSFGKPVLIKDDRKFVFQRHIAILRPNKSIVDSRYLYYTMSSQSFFSQADSFAIGAAQRTISLTSLRKMKVELPPLEMQLCVASILSTYDNLIENNNKRIRLLEQMAENLYKEWFVRFRFPGHENAEFENGLPKGWKRAQLKTICKFERGKNITASEMISGSVPVISAGVSPSGFHNQSNVFGASVTISSSGANAGFISIHYEDIWAADCSFISEESTKYIYYVYEVLNNMRPVVDNLQRGAAQPHVYPKDLNRILVVVPEEHIREKANDRFYQLHQLISKLLQQNKHLSRQRDLLLPRLMSGKLEVKV